MKFSKNTFYRCLILAFLALFCVGQIYCSAHATSHLQSHNSTDCTLCFAFLFQSDSALSDATNFTLLATTLIAFLLVSQKQEVRLFSLSTHSRAPPHFLN
jgi:hypothetical protein